MNRNDYCYVVPMFPYPSGKLHMGHVRNYVLSDVIARFYKNKGMEVFQPIGFDSFGLPAENAAIKYGVTANEWTEKNIQEMTDQLKQLNLAFNYEASVQTHKSDYYFYEQKFFKECFEKGYIYQKNTWVNYDPVDKTILSNEQVVDGKGWRSGADIIKKQVNGYYFDMKRWAKQLSENTDTLNWHAKIKQIQKKWIGYNEGFAARINFNNQAYDFFLNHPTPNVFKTGPFSKFSEEIYKDNSSLKIWFEEEMLKGSVSQKEKFKKEIISTGKNILINGVSIPIVIDPILDDELFGVIDEKFSGINQSNNSEAFSAKIVPSIQIKLKDWCLNRQRYWGTPIPIVHCDDCGSIPVETVQLPIEKQNTFSVLKESSFVQTNCPKCGNKACRETDTLDTFFESSWYFHHYVAKKNHENAMISSSPKMVDFYIGGAEHANLHLIYARAFNYVLNELGYVPFKEPIGKLINQGMVQKDGIKMSKSKGNTIDPQSYIDKYGADAIRMFMIFAAPPSDSFDFKDDAIVGSYRFINQIKSYFTQEPQNQIKPYTQDSIQKDMKNLNSYINKEFEGRMHFNNIIPQLMTFFKKLKQTDFSDFNIKNNVETEFLKHVEPFAPALVAEINSFLIKNKNVLKPKI